MSACGRVGPGPEVTFDFIAYGDCRHFAKVHRRICASMLTTSPKFVLSTGDLVDEPEKAEDWKEFQDVTRDLRARVEYVPAQGDHDGDGLRAEFGLPRRYYDKTFGDVHVFVLDSTEQFTDAEQLKWLETTASASTARHKIAVFHRPPFSIDADHGARDAVPIREKIHGLLVKLKFCAAFCGHNHAFYTTVRDGVRYVITGGGGAPLWDLDGSLAQQGDLWRSFHHYVGCTVRAGGIDARVIDQDGVEAKDLAFPLCRH